MPLKAPAGFLYKCTKNSGPLGSRPHHTNAGSGRVQEKPTEGKTSATRAAAAGNWRADRTSYLHRGKKGQGFPNSEWFTGALNPLLRFCRQLFRLVLADERRSRFF